MSEEMFQTEKDYGFTMAIAKSMLEKGLITVCELSLIHIQMCIRDSLGESYNRRRYLTAYSKEQEVEFGTVYIDRDGANPDTYSEGVILSSSSATLGAVSYTHLDVYKRQGMMPAPM